MTKTLIGTDSTGSPCIKITKGNLNPVTEPDSNYGSFLYNSKWAYTIKFAGIDRTTYVGATTYTPAGSGNSNYTKCQVLNTSGSNVLILRNTHFPTLDYEMPVFDYKLKRLSDNRFVEFQRYASTSGSDPGGRRATYWRTGDASNPIWWLNLQQVGMQGPNAVAGNALVASVGSLLYGATVVERQTVVWRLPGGNEPLKDLPPLTPVNGQTVVQLTSTQSRVSRPGYNVLTASQYQLAFDATNRPAKVIFARDVLLPLGTTTFDVGFPTNDGMVLNLFPYDNGQPVTFPMVPGNNALNIEYDFVGTTVRLHNIARQCRVRFIVIGYDDLPPTTGSNSVFRQIDVNGESVTQILRPGASANPRLSDIIIDSRWPCLQMLAEGYLPVTQNPNRTPFQGITGQTYNVNFSNAGNSFPIVKYMTVHENRFWNPGTCIRPPTVRLIDNYSGGLDWYNDGYSTYSEVVSNTQVRFYSFNGLPWNERYTNGWTYDWPDDPIVGIRYYVLGIPAEYGA